MVGITCVIANHSRVQNHIWLDGCEIVVDISTTLVQVVSLQIFCVVDELTDILNNIIVFEYVGSGEEPSTNRATTLDNC